MSAKRDLQRSQSEVLQRGETRVPGVQDISLSYEGSNEEIHIRPPNLSARGMFVSTSRIFPEGAVLNLRFWLAHTQAEVQTRCEVRHCLPGVGIGVEFIGISSEAERQIAREIDFETRGALRRESSGPRKKQDRKKMPQGRSLRSVIAKRLVDVRDGVRDSHKITPMKR